MRKLYFLIMLMVTLGLFLPSMTMADAPIDNDQVIVLVGSDSDPPQLDTMLSWEPMHTNSINYIQQNAQFSPVLDLSKEYPFAVAGAMELYPGIDPVAIQLFYEKNFRPRMVIPMNVAAWEVNGFGQGTEPMDVLSLDM